MALITNDASRPGLVEDSAQAFCGGRTCPPNYGQRAWSSRRNSEEKVCAECQVLLNGIIDQIYPTTAGDLVLVDNRIRRNGTM